jgi:leader peptidase (prepilin peptidase)/N-methyltransferase
MGGGRVELMIIKDFSFAIILIVAGYIDIKTKTIPDYIHVLIIIVGLINIDVFQSVIGLIIVPLPFFIMACFKEDSIGGGDIKLMGACGFFLGVTDGLVASVVGLVIAVVVNGFYYWIKNKDKTIGFALAPYLGLGCMCAYIMRKMVV